MMVTKISQIQTDPNTSVIMENQDKAIVDRIRNALKERDGFCPCAPRKTPDTLCPCKNFRDKVKDPSYSGYCHCRLYYKPARVMIVDYENDYDNTEHAGERE